jgi:N-formylglutamate amidohydrolase
MNRDRQTTPHAPFHRPEFVAVAKPAAIDRTRSTWPYIPQSIRRDTKRLMHRFAMNSPTDAFDPPFEVLKPVRQAAPAVFNSPHSGRIYPDSFLITSRLDALALRRSEDCFIDELFEAAVALGCPLLKANFPRAFLDVNREPYELDPAMFADRLPDFANTSSLRVAGGLGTIPRIVSEHEEIYKGPLSFAEVEARIERLYRPYHATLRSLIKATATQFGYCLLVDCHSMPSTAAPPGSAGRGIRADVVLGDRHGSTASAALTGAMERAFAAQGFAVVRNKPYAGGFITQAYGRPHDGLHAIQVEINRAAYVDERTVAPNRDFSAVKQAVAASLRDFLMVLPDLFQARRIAAE